MSTTATLQQQQKAFSDDVREYIQQLQNDLASGNEAIRNAALNEVEKSLKDSGVINKKGNVKKIIVSWK